MDSLAEHVVERGPLAGEEESLLVAPLDEEASARPLLGWRHDAPYDRDVEDLLPMPDEQSDQQRRSDMVQIGRPLCRRHTCTKNSLQSVCWMG